MKKLQRHRFCVRMEVSVLMRIGVFLHRYDEEDKTGLVKNNKSGYFKISRCKVV